MDKNPKDSRKLLESLRERALAILDAAELATRFDIAVAAIGEIRALTEQLERTEPRTVLVSVLDPRTGEPVPLEDLLPPLGSKSAPE